MEWTCARCGQIAVAAEWSLLATIGWRNDGSSATCVVCVKQKPPTRRTSVGSGAEADRSAEAARRRGSRLPSTAAPGPRS
jgi:hypothetical protein